MVPAFDPFAAHGRIVMQLAAAASRHVEKTHPGTTTDAIARFVDDDNNHGRLHAALDDVTPADGGACVTRGYIPETEYLVNAPPATPSEFGPSAAYTLPSASTATPSPAAPW